MAATRASVKVDLLLEVDRTSTTGHSPTSGPVGCFVLAIVEKVVVAQDRLLGRSQALSDQALRPIGGGECSSCTRIANERATDLLVAQQQLELLVSNLDL